MNAADLNFITTSVNSDLIGVKIKNPTLSVELETFINKAMILNAKRGIGELNLCYSTEMDTYRVNREDIFLPDLISREKISEFQSLIERHYGDLGFKVYICDDLEQNISSIDLIWSTKPHLA